jgi:uncharacterized protein (TIGR00288 family)
MAANDTASMALFCDFENVALGVRDAQYDKFDIRPVLERLLAKGSIVVKKAYCDWDRYKAFKSAMHEANFELIEIPHVRQSGKNSADIRMVVDALDLCYTKAHVDTFVIISGDSDFSPLVSKLRENAKKVIGVGVKQSCSDLLVTNCDEFIYYDDLVRDREAGRSSQRREREKRSPEEEARRREKLEERKTKAVDLVAATFADLMADRGEAERTWASVLKEVVKRRNPGFSESYYGFRTFGNLLEEAASRGLLTIGRDEKSGNYVTRARPNDGDGSLAEVAIEAAPVALEASVAGEAGQTIVVEEKTNGRRRGGRRTRKEARLDETAVSPDVSVSSEEAVAVAMAPVEPAVTEAPAEKPKRATRRPRKTAVAPVVPAAVELAPPPMPAENPPQAVESPAGKKPARKTTRSRKPKKVEGTKKTDESAG